MKLHKKLGRVLSREKSEKDKMEVDKPQVVLLPHQDLDFIF